MLRLQVDVRGPDFQVLSFFGCTGFRGSLDSLGSIGTIQGFMLRNSQAGIPTPPAHGASSVRL